MKLFDSGRGRADQTMATHADDPAAVVRRLIEATNRRDLTSMVACFAPDYRNETPVHPSRGFVGREQVRRNWVQIFAADLKEYATFNQVYRTFFKGPLPARAFLGTASLLGNAHFEVMGIAVRQK